MYVCTECNIAVEKPEARLFRRYCERGPRLLDAVIVQSFWGAFVRKFAITLVVVYAVLLALAFNPDCVRGAAERRIYAEMVRIVFGLMLFVVFLKSLRSFREANLWKRRGGAVQKLIPRARGNGLGYVSVAGLLAIFVWPSVW